MRILWGLALLCLLVLPNATAHATVPSDDGTWCITTGNRFEPVTTWHRTALELIITQAGSDCQSANRVEVADLAAHESLVATIKAPTGETLDCTLAKQHGGVNRYTCTEPYILTEPGQYLVHLEGDIDGSPVNADYNIAGPLPDAFQHTFPAADLQSLAELEARIDALEQENADLAQRIAALEGQENNSATNGIPGVAPVLVAFALLVFAARRRQ